jgi:ABC-2 type transport system ATP-binding protein
MRRRCGGCGGAVDNWGVTEDHGARQEDGAGAVLVVRAEELRAARRVLVAREVSLSAAAGDVVAVEGPNGSGKSTLLAAAAGLLPTGRGGGRNGRGGRRPASVGYAPERADVLPRLAVRRWLTGLARTAGLSRAEAAGQADDLLARVGLAGSGHRPLRTLSRGNVQRALVAQALVGPPGLVVLDEPSGGLDRDGLGRVTAEIQRAAGRSSVVLVARHPTAPLPLPAGPAWRIGDGAVRAEERAADEVPLVEVEIGDGPARHVTESELPAILRAALDAGQPVRRVQALDREGGGEAAAAATAGPAPRRSDGEVGLVAGNRGAGPRRAGALSRIVHGAAYRGRLLAVSQWFAAPALLLLIVLGIVYGGPVGPLLPAAAFVAVVLIPVVTWVTVLAHLADGRLMARAFAAHVGGRGRAHLAACLAGVPFAVAATVAAVAWSTFSQPFPSHQPGLLLQMAVLDLAAASLGIGVAALLVPPLVERAGWRVCLAAALFLALLLIRVSPARPLLLLATHHGAGWGTVGAAAGLLAGTGAVLVGAATVVAIRLP